VFVLASRPSHLHRCSTGVHFSLRVLPSDPWHHKQCASSALDEIEMVLDENEILLAVNIHSFSECSRSSIGWWLDLLTKHRVPYIFVVPNAEWHGGTRLLTQEPAGNKRQDFMPATSSSESGRSIVPPACRSMAYRQPTIICSNLRHEVRCWAANEQNPRSALHPHPFCPSSGKPWRAWARDRPELSSVYLMVLLVPRAGRG